MVSYLQRWSLFFTETNIKTKKTSKIFGRGISLRGGQNAPTELRCEAPDVSDHFRGSRHRVSAPNHVTRCHLRSSTGRCCSSGELLCVRSAPLRRSRPGRRHARRGLALTAQQHGQWVVSTGVAVLLVDAFPSESATNSAMVNRLTLRCLRASLSLPGVTASSGLLPRVVRRSAENVQEGLEAIMSTRAVLIGECVAVGGRQGQALRADLRPGLDCRSRGAASIDPSEAETHERGDQAWWRRVRHADGSIRCRDPRKRSDSSGGSQGEPPTRPGRGILEMSCGDRASPSALGPSTMCGVRAPSLGIDYWGRNWSTRPLEFVTFESAACCRRVWKSRPMVKNSPRCSSVDQVLTALLAMPRFDR